MGGKRERNGGKREGNGKEAGGMRKRSEGSGKIIHRKAEIGWDAKTVFYLRQPMLHCFLAKCVSAKCKYTLARTDPYGI